jgi:hypothetical protein
MHQPRELTALVKYRPLAGGDFPVPPPIATSDGAAQGWLGPRWRTSGLSRAAAENEKEKKLVVVVACMQAGPK